MADDANRALVDNKKRLRDAMNALTQAHADVKNAMENGRDCSLVALTAAVDDVTAAVSAATEFGGSDAAGRTDQPAPSA